MEELCQAHGVEGGLAPSGREIMSLGIVLES